MNREILETLTTADWKSWTEDDKNWKKSIFRITDENIEVPLWTKLDMKKVKGFIFKIEDGTPEVMTCPIGLDYIKKELPGEVFEARVNNVGQGPYYPPTLFSYMRMLRDQVAPHFFVEHIYPMAWEMVCAKREKRQPNLGPHKVEELKKDKDGNFDIKDLL